MNEWSLTELEERVCVIERKMSCHPRMPEMVDDDCCNKSLPIYDKLNEIFRLDEGIHDYFYGETHIRIFAHTCHCFTMREISSFVNYAKCDPIIRSYHITFNYNRLILVINLCER